MHAVHLQLMEMTGVISQVMCSYSISAATQYCWCVWLRLTWSSLGLNLLFSGLLTPTPGIRVPCVIDIYTHIFLNTSAVSSGPDGIESISSIQRTTHIWLSSGVRF